MFVALSLGRLLYVLMEFCSEGPLTKYLGGHTDMAQRDNWVLDLARGLQHIHSSLVIHRDIKTDNLLVAIGSSGQKIIKYIDFGLAIELSEPTSIIDDGKLKGTPTYMSPELEARRPYAFPTDLWSLGVVFLQVIQSCQPQLHYFYSSSSCVFLNPHRSLLACPNTICRQTRSLIRASARRRKC